MKKILLSLFLFSCMPLGAARTFAQSADSLRVVVDSLSLRVAKLEHDLTLLKVNTDITTLDAAINRLSIEFRGIGTDLQIITIANKIGTLSKSNKKDYDSVLKKSYKVHKEGAELLKKELDSLQELINSSKDLFSASENLHISLAIMRILVSYNNLEGQLKLIGELLEK